MSLLNQSAALKHLIDCDPGILKFENVDKDADGQISEEELREWLSEFVEVTNKKDEKHDLEEALQVMQDSYKWCIDCKEDGVGLLQECRCQNNHSEVPIFGATAHAISHEQCCKGRIS